MIPVAASLTKTSFSRLASLPKFEAWLVNATIEPSLEISGPGPLKLSPFPCTPDESTLTRRVTPRLRSRTNTSWNPFVSPATKFVATLVKTTKRPSGRANPPKLSAFPCLADEERLTSSVIPSNDRGRRRRNGRCHRRDQIRRAAGERHDPPVGRTRSDVSLTAVPLDSGRIDG